MMASMFNKGIGLIRDCMESGVGGSCFGNGVMAADGVLPQGHPARAGYHTLIPLDGGIGTRERVVGRMLCKLRFSNRGGLSITPTASALGLQPASCRAA